MIFFVIAISAFFSWLFLLLSTPFFKIYFSDLPNARSSHASPVPRGGGLSFVIVATVGCGLSVLSANGGWSALLITCVLPLAVVGLLDDFCSLSTFWRYGIQLLTASALLATSPLFMSLIRSLPFVIFVLVGGLLLFSVTAVINFTNFMDGLDGLVAGCMAVVFCTASLHMRGTSGLWILVGSLLGFLLWNWSPAKIFMGDVGSTFLGAVWAGVVLQAPTWPDAFGLLLVGSPLLADAFFCIPRRYISGHQIFQAHRLHLFQRLHQAGWPHSRVALLYISVTVILGITSLVASWAVVSAVAFLVFMAGVWLDQRVAVPFSESLTNKWTS